MIAYRCSCGTFFVSQTFFLKKILNCGFFYCAQWISENLLNINNFLFYGIIDSQPKFFAKNDEKNANPYFFWVTLYIYDILFYIQILFDLDPRPPPPQRKFVYTLDLTFLIWSCGGWNAVSMYFIYWITENIIAKYFHFKLFFWEICFCYVGFC